MPRRPVVLTVATNGLHRQYQHFIDTHLAYATRYGYEHFLVSNVGCKLTPKESAWLRIPIMRILIESGPVLYIDADAEFRPAAPSIDSAQVPGKSVYMAYGISGRFNSGVMYVSERNAAGYLDEMLSNYNTPIPKTDQAPYENGHVIHFAKKYSAIIHPLDRRWNNTLSEDMDDYIRHYTNTLKHLRANCTSAGSAQKPSILYRAVSKAKRIRLLLPSPVRDKTAPKRLTSLASKVVALQFPG